MNHDDHKDKYLHSLEKLWDMLSDAVENGRLLEHDIPDDYKAFIHQMEQCEAYRAFSLAPTHYQRARNAIVLTATRPDGFNGATRRCGLAYVGGEWLEVHTGISGGVFKAASFSHGLYQHITPGSYDDLLRQTAVNLSGEANL